MGAWWAAVLPTTTAVAPFGGETLREEGLMRRMPKVLTRRTTVLGLPVGKRRTDWAKVGRLGMVGLSTISAVADVAEAFRDARGCEAAGRTSMNGEAGDRATQRHA